MLFADMESTFVNVLQILAGAFGGATFLGACQLLFRYLTGGKKMAQDERQTLIANFKVLLDRAQKDNEKVWNRFDQLESAARAERQMAEAQRASDRRDHEHAMDKKRTEISRLNEECRALKERLVAHERRTS